MLNSHSLSLWIIPCLTKKNIPFTILLLMKGGEADEVDVSSCNALLRKRLNTLVLSTTQKLLIMVERTTVKPNRRFKKPTVELPAFFAFAMIQRVNACETPYR